MWRFLAIVLGIGASLLAVLAIAVNYGYIPTTFVNGFTATELGVFAALAVVGAIGCEAAEQRKKGRSY